MYERVLEQSLVERQKDTQTLWLLELLMEPKILTFCHFYLWLMKHLTHLDQFGGWGPGWMWCVTLSIRADTVWLFLIGDNHQSCSGRRQQIFKWGIVRQNIIRVLVGFIHRFMKYKSTYKYSILKRKQKSAKYHATWRWILFLFLGLVHFWMGESRGSLWATFTIGIFLPEHSFMLKSYGWMWWWWCPMWF